MSRGVVVTGLGVVSCLGVDAAAHLRRLLAGESGVAPLTGSRRRGLPVHFEMPVQGFEARRAIRNRTLRKLLQPSGAFAVAAAGEALADAGLIDPELAGAGRGEEEAADPRLAGAGLYFGSVSYDVPSRIYVPALRASFGPDERFQFERFGRQGVALVDPLLIVKGLPNAALCGIAIEHGIQGPNANFANGAAAGLEAVIAAAEAVRWGEVEVAVAGGSDCLLQPEHLIEHTLRGRLWTGEAPRATGCRPFAAGRQGYLPGEGAAVVVLESAEHARERGARAYAEILGDGETAAGPGDEEEALLAAALAALGGVAGGPADALFAQGIGTPADDLREARVAEALFGGRVPVTAAGGALGYTGAAGGILAFVHAIWSLAHGWLPPTIGCDDPDPACRVPLVRAGERRERRPLRTALAWATDEGRKNAAVLCGRAAESR